MVVLTMTKDLTKVVILHYNPKENTLKELYNKEVTFDEYLATEPLKYCEMLVSDTTKAMETVFISEDASVGIYKMDRDLGLLIQTFEHTN